MAYGIDGRQHLAAAGTWSGWESLDIASTGIANSPAVAINSDGRLEAFVVYGGTGLWHKWQTSGGGGGGDTTPPVQVAGLSATTVSSTQINLGWTANTETDLNHYNVYRGTTAGFVVTPGTTVPIATPATNSYSNTGLSPSTTYYYKVAAVDNAGNIGAVSAERSATTSPAADTTPPVQVAGLSATTVSSTQINLGWTANTETDLNHYNVYRGTTAGFVVTPGTTVPIATPATNSYSNTGLSPSTTYYYKVAAVDNAGNIGAVSAERSATTSPAADTTPPVQVTGLSATTVSSTQINLGWTANTETDLNHYNVYRGTTAGFVVTPGTTVPIATPATNSYSNTGLSPSTTYYYKVAAVDNAGNIGAVSAERSATTSPAADTTPPTVTITSPINNARVPAGNLIVSGTSQDNVGGTGVNNVAVQLDGGTFVTATGTTNWSITINITKKGAHQLRARAQDNAGNSGFSSTVKINIQ